MRKELEEKLFAIEPEFFNRKDMRASLMCFGFECGNGWYPLVDVLIHEAKHRKDNPAFVPNETYVEGSKFDYDDPTTMHNRPPLSCLPDNRKGWLENPDRVEREETTGEYSDCPFTTDPRKVRDFICIDGNKVLKDSVDIYKKDKHWTYDLCPGCEGTQHHIYYHHKCENWWNHFQIEQVKEKYGGLRFYVNGADDRYYGMIDFAESMSMRICEICGTWGTLVDTKGWLKTLCDSCRKNNEVNYKLL